MASKTEEEEGKIPVFTVLKNNTIIKNIFIVNKPPSPPPSPSPPRTSHEDVLMVGRHPDCDLMLTHPSISRFHLEIRSTPSSQSLSVLDLSSVHGTWVSGRKVEPGVSVEMKEGDTLRIGVSSRVYRLHWIPISRAYDMENPFVSQLDVVPEEEQAAEQQEQEEEEEEERKQNLKNCLPVETEEIQSVDSLLECINSLFLDESSAVTEENGIPASPPMPEDTMSFFCEEERKSPFKEEMTGVLNDPFGSETSSSTTANGENKLSDSLNQLLNVKEIPSAPPMLEGIISFCCEEEKKSQSRDETFGVPSSNVENKLCDSINQVRSPPYGELVVKCDDTWTEYLSEGICLQTVEVVQGTEMQQFYTSPDTITSPLPSGLQDSYEKHSSSLLINTDPASVDEKNAAEAVIIPAESEFECTVKDTGRVTDILTAGIGFFDYEDTFLPVEKVISETSCQQIKVVEEVGVGSLSDGEKQDPCGEEYMSKMQQQLNVKSSREQGHSLDEVVKDIGNEGTGGICSTSLQAEPVNSSMPPEAVLKIKKENHTLQSNKEILGNCIEAIRKKSTNSNIWLRRGKSSSAPQIQTSKSISMSTANVDMEVEMSKKKDIINKTISKNLFSVLDGEEEEDDEVFTPDKENFSPNTLQFLYSKKKGMLEEVKHSKSQRSHNSKDSFSLDVYPDKVMSHTSSKESQKDLFFVLDGEKEEIFTPDKENFSPNTLQLHLLKKKGNVEEIKCSKAQSSQNLESKFSANIYPDDSISSSSHKKNQAPKVAQEHKSRRKPFGSLELAQRSQNSKGEFSATSKKENPTPKVCQEHMSRRKPFGSHIELVKEQDIMALNNRAERVPFQLLMDAGGIACPVFAAKGIDVGNCGQILNSAINPSDISWEQKRSWDMVVDTSTLMNKESRKALQLLQGLWGTRLIIPRLVIRELDSMKRQCSIFRRISESSLVLEWIEECMVKTRWWIHIESSMEEERLIAPTPPASPHSQFSEEESWTSSHRCSMEIASPTAEDHILDFALLYKRRQNDGQLVLLSEDVTLKIKCMAEGLLCEPVQEFRESLVNPFSERFLWTNSSPRGQTWSCQDDVVLREKYCRLPVRKSSKGAASGLKLILLHNSQYGH